MSGDGELLDTLLIRETCGVDFRRSYHVEPSQSNWKPPKIIVKEEAKSWQSLTTFFTVVFLPHGFPDSVSKDYIPYQIWDSIQAFASSITGSICTHAILKGAGVGDETASPLAATITWLIKDGTSMIGRICFAWLQGTKLDSDCKKWRLFADVLNDIAMFLDLVSAYFQNHFTLIVCISGLCKSLVGVAGGSTRAALTQHQARKNNMADVSAKDGSQETLVNLLALICSLFIVPIVAESFLLTWILYISMTIVHLTANYFAVKSVVMEIFNISRFKIYTKHYLSEGSASQDFLSVAEVNQKESLCPSFSPKRVTVILGSSFKDAIQGKRWKDIKELLEIYKTTDYILCVSKTSISKFVIYIAFSRKATAITHMEALYQACYVEQLLEKSHVENEVIGYLTRLITDNTIWAAVRGAVDIASIRYEEQNILTGMGLAFGPHYAKVKYCATTTNVEDEGTTQLESVSRQHTRKTFSYFLSSLKAMGFNTNTVAFDIGLWVVDW